MPIALIALFGLLTVGVADNTRMAKTYDMSTCKPTADSGNRNIRVCLPKA